MSPRSVLELFLRDAVREPLTALSNMNAVSPNKETEIEVVTDSHQELCEPLFVCRLMSINLAKLE